MKVQYVSGNDFFGYKFVSVVGPDYKYCFSMKPYVIAGYSFITKTIYIRHEIWANLPLIFKYENLFHELLHGIIDTLDLPDDLNYLLDKIDGLLQDYKIIKLGEKRAIKIMKVVLGIQK